METKNVEIARVGLCSEKAVGRAIERGLLDAGDLQSVVEWVVRMRIKKLGFMRWLDVLADPGDLPDVVGGLMGSGSVKRGSEIPAREPVGEPGDDLVLEPDPGFEGFSE